MKLTLDLYLGGLEAHLDYLEVGVGALRQRASMKAAENIMIEALDLIPIDTASAAKSKYIYYEGYQVKFGFSDDAHGVLNPKSGQMTWEYITQLHEDMSAIHPNGEAKFLETAIEHHRADITDILTDEYTDLFSGFRPTWRGTGKQRGR